MQWAKVGDKGGYIENEDNLSGDAWVSGNARVYGNADYCCCQSFGSEGRTTTVFKEKSGKIRIKCGCFDGDLESFARQVEQTHGDNQFGREYKAMIELIKVKFNIKE